MNFFIILASILAFIFILMALSTELYGLAFIAAVFIGFIIYLTGSNKTKKR